MAAAARLSRRPTCRPARNQPSTRSAAPPAMAISLGSVRARAWRGSEARRPRLRPRRSRRRCRRWNWRRHHRRHRHHRPLLQLAAAALSPPAASSGPPRQAPAATRAPPPAATSPPPPGGARQPLSGTCAIAPAVCGTACAAVAGSCTARPAPGEKRRTGRATARSLQPSRAQPLRPRRRLGQPDGGRHGLRRDDAVDHLRQRRQRRRPRALRRAEQVLEEEQAQETHAAVGRRLHRGQQRLQQRRPRVALAHRGSDISRVPLRQRATVGRQRLGGPPALARKGQGCGGGFGPAPQPASRAWRACAATCTTRCRVCDRLPDDPIVILFF